jgi:hypothetical protein
MDEVTGFWEFHIAALCFNAKKVCCSKSHRRLQPSSKKFEIRGGGIMARETNYDFFFFFSKKVWND